jgi:hypothetical protein
LFGNFYCYAWLYYPSILSLAEIQATEAFINSRYSIYGTGSVFPAISSSRLWLDRNQKVFSDAGGTTPATITGSVGSWQAIGGAWGTDLFAQSNASFQPTLQSDGIQGDGTNDRLTRSSAFAITGDYTFYSVMSRASFPQIIAGLSNSTNDAGIVVYGSQTYSTTDSLVGTGIADTVTGLVIRRCRRSGNTFYVESGTTAEVSFSGATVLGNITIDQIIGRGSIIDSSDAAARIRQLVLVNKNITPGDADDQAIIAKLLQLEPDAAW